MSPVMQVVPLAGDHMSHTAGGVFDISGVAWNDVNVNMGDRLPGGQADVEPHIEAIWMKALSQEHFYAVGYQPAGGFGVGGKVKVVSNVLFGNDQRVAGRDGKFVKNGVGSSRFGKEFPLSVGGAEGARSWIGVWQLVVVPIFVDLGAFCTKKAAVRQSDVTLINTHIVLDMSAKPIALDIAPHGKVSLTFGLEQFRNGHQHMRLFLRKQYVEHIQTQNGVKFSLRWVGCIMWIVADSLKTPGL